MFVIFFIINIITFFFINATPVAAHCPLCVIGAGIGVSLSRLLGVDDSITGIWLAAFLGATSFWFTTFTLRKIKFSQKKSIVYALFFASTVWSFYQFKLIDLHSGSIFNLPKLIFGLLVGGISFYLIDIVNTLIIKIHHGVFFPYQRIVVSLGSIWLLSLFMYILINYFI